MVSGLLRRLVVLVVASTTFHAAVASSTVDTSADPDALWVERDTNQAAQEQYVLKIATHG